MKKIVLKIGGVLLAGVVAGCSGIKAETMTTPVRLKIGDSKSLYVNDGHTQPDKDGKICSDCPPVPKGKVIYAWFKPLESGCLWVDTLEMDPRADTLLRVKYGTSKMTCDDDISATDKRSKISKWWVKKDDEYRITVGINDGTDTYDLMMRLHLTNSFEEFAPCFYKE